MHHLRVLLLAPQIVVFQFDTRLSQARCCRNTLHEPTPHDLSVVLSHWSNNGLVRLDLAPQVK
jgi:hypothetical protein